MSYKITTSKTFAKKHKLTRRAINNLQMFADRFEVNIKAGCYGKREWDALWTSDRLIKVNTTAFTRGSNYLYSIILHECGHQYCADWGLWKSYHMPKTKKDVKRSLYVAFKAENWVNDWASRMMKFLLPAHRFVLNFRNDEENEIREWYKNDSYKRMKQWGIK